MLKHVFYNELNTHSLLESFTNNPLHFLCNLCGSVTNLNKIFWLYVRLSLYTRPMGENGGSRMNDGGGCSVFFLAFLFSSSETASSKCLTSSSRINFSEFEYSLCLFSWPRAEAASELCSIEMQIENACSAENCAWKSTEYSPFPSDAMDRAGAFSFRPCWRKTRKHGVRYIYIYIYGNIAITKIIFSTRVWINKNLEPTPNPYDAWTGNSLRCSSKISMLSAFLLVDIPTRMKFY